MLSRVAGCLMIVARRVSGALHSVGVGVLAAMMLLTASDVILRYFFNRPIRGSFDLTEYMMIIVFAFGLAYCAVNKGHVTVDIILDRLTPKTRTIINIITSPFSLALLCLMTWQSFLYAKIQFSTDVSSAVLPIPRFPFAALLALGFASLTLALLADFLQLLSEVKKEWRQSP